jgi:hypothetical protein
MSPKESPAAYRARTTNAIVWDWTAFVLWSVWHAAADGARIRFAEMPFYDSNFNRVLVTIERPEQRSRVYAQLKSALIGVSVPAPDSEGRIDIGLDQDRNSDAALAIRKALDREWPDSADWIRVEATSRRL